MDKGFTPLAPGRRLAQRRTVLIPAAAQHDIFGQSTMHPTSAMSAAQPLAVPAKAGPEAVRHRCPQTSLPRVASVFILARSR
jgi:hypothetical protein